MFYFITVERHKDIYHNTGYLKGIFVVLNINTFQTFENCLLNNFI